MIWIRSLSAKGNTGVEAVDEIVGQCNVIALAGSGDQADRKTECLCRGMDFSAQPAPRPTAGPRHGARRSEEHTSELQSLMRISYAVFCLNKKKNAPIV